MRKFRLLWLVSIWGVWSCQEELYVPKPRIYPRVELPQGDMVLFQHETCDFDFERPDYTTVSFEPRLSGEEAQHPCWFDLNYPDLGCTVHFSYYPIDEENPLSKLNDDAYRMTNEHNRKATYIEELQVKNPNGTRGVIFDLEGPVATPFQFYLTDSTSHFLRGALYFNSQIRPDSLAPYYEFVKQDLAHLINTFSWTS